VKGRIKCPRRKAPLRGKKEEGFLARTKDITLKHTGSRGSSAGAKSANGGAHKTPRPELISIKMFRQELQLTIIQGRPKTPVEKPPRKFAHRDKKQSTSFSTIKRKKKGLYIQEKGKSRKRRDHSCKNQFRSASSSHGVTTTILYVGERKLKGRREEALQGGKGLHKKTGPQGNTLGQAKHTRGKTG